MSLSQRAGLITLLFKKNGEGDIALEECVTPLESLNEISPRV